MTRSTASRVVAVLILGAAISSSVLAAPTPSPMIASSIGARDLQPQSSTDGLGTLSEGQTEELARVPTPQRGGKNGDGLTLDKSEHKRSDPNVTVSVNLNQQVNVAKRGNSMSDLKNDLKKKKQRKKMIQGLRAEKAENERYLNDFTEEWFEAVLNNDRTKRLQLLTDKVPGSEVPNHVRIKNLRNTLKSVKNDPEFVKLWEFARRKWIIISQWVREQLKEVDTSWRRIQPQWDYTSIQPDKLEREAERRVLFMEYRDEVEWMADLSKVALEMQLCDEKIADQYANLWAEFQQNPR